MDQDDFRNEEVTDEEKAVDAFLADSRTIRYEETDANRDALLGFLETHGLDITHRNLLFAYDSLQDVLELVPFRSPIPAEPQPSARPTAPQPPVATAPLAQRTFAYRNGLPLEIGNARSI